MRLLFFLSALILAQCSADESLTAYGASGKSWQLQEIDGIAFGEMATISFPKPMSFGGDAPCNSFSGTISAPYPWFEIKEMRVTERACPALAAEQSFLTTLGRMTEAEVSGNTLILRGNGQTMLFRSDA